MEVKKARSERVEVAGISKEGKDFVQRSRHKLLALEMVNFRSAQFDAVPQMLILFTCVRVDSVSEFASLQIVSLFQSVRPCLRE